MREGVRCLRWKRDFSNHFLTQSQFEKKVEKSNDQEQRANFSEEMVDIDFEDRSVKCVGDGQQHNAG
jgi:hypothetical protein